MWHYSTFCEKQKKLMLSLSSQINMCEITTNDMGQQIITSKVAMMSYQRKTCQSTLVKKGFTKMKIELDFGGLVRGKKERIMVAIYLSVCY